MYTSMKSQQCQYQYLSCILLGSVLLTLIQVSMVGSQGMIAIPSPPSESDTGTTTSSMNTKTAKEKAEIHKKIAEGALGQTTMENGDGDSASEDKVPKRIIRKDKPVELQNPQKHASDEWLLHFLLEQYSLSETSDSNVEEQVDILQNLEHFAHKFENGRDLFQSTNALKKILLPALNSSYPEIRKASCGVFAVAAQNNRIVQKTALENFPNIVRRLVHLLTFDLASVRAKALYALSSLLRNYPEAQAKFIQDGGLSALVKAASLSETRKRGLNFITDLLLERKFCRQELETGTIVDDPSDACDSERLLEKSLQSNGYCEILAESLKNVGSFDTEHQTLITEAIEATISFCAETIAPQAILLHKLLIKFERDENSSAAQVVQFILAQVDPLSLASRDEL